MTSDHYFYDENGPFFPDDEDYLIDGVGFAQEGSALRAATEDNPRDQKCPSCGWPNRLTHIDVARGYQCDSCANAAETGRDIDYYEGDDEFIEEYVEDPDNHRGPDGVLGNDFNDKGW